jgi:hypothetical protein
MKLTTERLKQLIKEELEEMDIQEQRIPKDGELFKNMVAVAKRALQKAGVPANMVHPAAGSVALEIALYLEDGAGNELDTVKPYQTPIHTPGPGE